MRNLHNSSFDPPTLVVLEGANSSGFTVVLPFDLSVSQRSVLRLATEGKRDPMRLHDRALEGLIPATAWREASWSHWLLTVSKMERHAARSMPPVEVKEASKSTC
jgi:hypothetical protein